MQNNFLKQFLKIVQFSVLGTIIGIILNKAIAFLVITILKDSLHGFMGLGLSFILYGLLSTLEVLLSALITGLFLIRSQRKNTVILATLAVVTITGSSSLIYVFSNNLPSFFHYIFLFLLVTFIYFLYWLIITKLHPVFVSLLIIMILTSLSVWGIPKISKSLGETNYNKELAASAQKLDFTLYATPQSDQRHHLERVDYSIHEPNVIKLYYDYYKDGFIVHVFKPQENFKPPEDCGYDMPVKTPFVLYKCSGPITTKKGRIIYPGGQGGAYREAFLSQIDNTLLVITRLPKNTSDEEISEFIDAFEPTTYEELKKRSDEVQKQNKVN